MTLFQQEQCSQLLVTLQDAARQERQDAEIFHAKEKDQRNLPGLQERIAFERQQVRKIYLFVIQKKNKKKESNMLTSLAFFCLFICLLFFLLFFFSNNNNNSQFAMHQMHKQQHLLQKHNVGLIIRDCFEKLLCNLNEISNCELRDFGLIRGISFYFFSFFSDILLTPFPLFFKIYIGRNLISYLMFKFLLFELLSRNLFAWQEPFFAQPIRFSTLSILSSMELGVQLVFLESMFLTLTFCQMLRAHRACQASTLTFFRRILKTG